MILLHFDQHYNTGTYKAWSRNGHSFINMTCPKCSGVSSLKYIRFDENGISITKVRCPRAECDFNEVIKLKGWKTVGAEVFAAN